MRVQVVDKQLTKKAIIKYLQDYLQITVPKDISDKDLDVYVTANRKDIDWDVIASQYLQNKYSKSQLFHYYFESFQREITNKFTVQDLYLLEDQIVYAILNKIPLNQQYQQKIKKSLSQEYHRTTFNLTFHNTKRRVTRQIQRNNYQPYKFQSIKVPQTNQISNYQSPDQKYLSSQSVVVGESISEQSNFIHRREEQYEKEQLLSNQSKSL